MCLLSYINRDASGNALNGTIPSYLATTLTYLYGKGVNFLTNMQRLKWQHTHWHNYFINVSTDTSYLAVWCLWDVFSSIHRYLSDNSLNGTVPSSFSNLSSLQSLYECREVVFSPANRYLNDNELSGTIPSSFSLFTIVYRLYERRCMFFPSPINRDLSDNSLNGTIPSSLFYCSVMAAMSEFILCCISQIYKRSQS